MQKQFEILKATRKNILKAIENLSENQLNKIPDGFNNNIAWNVVHIVVTQQLLCYKLSGLAMYIDNTFVDRFKKGSVASNVTKEEWDSIKVLLLEFPKKLENDYNAGFFRNYDKYSTSYNVTLNKVEDAIQFNNVHESLHLGYIMAMKKSLTI